MGRVGSCGFRESLEIEKQRKAGVHVRWDCPSQGQLWHRGCNAVETRFCHLQPWVPTNSLGWVEGLELHAFSVGTVHFWNSASSSVKWRRWTTQVLRSPLVILWLEPTFLLTMIILWVSASTTLQSSPSPFETVGHPGGKGETRIFTWSDNSCSTWKHRPQVTFSSFFKPFI